RNRTYARKARMAAGRIESAALADHRILEIGCGGGFFTRELALRLPRAAIVATDAFEPMLHACRERVRDLPNVSVRQMDAGGSLADGSGDSSAEDSSSAPRPEVSPAARARPGECVPRFWPRERSGP